MEFAELYAQMKNTRIAFLLPNFEGGGAERSFVNLANYYASHGLSVEFLVGHSIGSYRTLVDPKIKVTDFSKQNILQIIPDLIRYLRQNRTDILLSTIEYPNFAALLAAWLSGTKTKVIIQIATDISSMVGKRTSFRGRLMEKITPRLYRYASYVIPVSTGSAESVVKFANLDLNKVRVIYNPVDLPTVQRLQNEPLDHPWFSNQSDPVIIAVGRLEPVKDFPTLIKAFAQVRSEKAAKLVILGEGPEREYLTNLIAQLELVESVDLPGFVMNPFQYMRHAQVLVLSSTREGLPTVLVEALACGCPVVSTNCRSGPAEILDEGRYGELVEVGDSKALGKAILKTIENPIAKAKLLKRANDFSLENIAKQYLEVIVKVSQKTQSRI